MGLLGLLFGAIGLGATTYDSMAVSSEKRSRRNEAAENGELYYSYMGDWYTVDTNERCAMYMNGSNRTIKVIKTGRVIWDYATERNRKSRLGAMQQGKKYYSMLYTPPADFAQPIKVYVELSTGEMYIFEHVGTYCHISHVIPDRNDHKGYTTEFVSAENSDLIYEQTFYLRDIDDIT